MMNVADRKHATAPADAQSWLESFEAALQAQDAARRRSCSWPTDCGATCWLLPGTLQTMAGRPSIEATLRQTLARTKPTNFHIPPKANAAALGQPRRHRSHRGHLRIRDRVRPMATASSALSPIRKRRRVCAPGRWSRPCKNSADTKRLLRNARRGPTTMRATSAATTGSIGSTTRALMPIATPRSLLSAAARPGSRSRRVCISSASIR